MWAGVCVCQDSPRSSPPITIWILLRWALLCLSHVNPHVQRYFQPLGGGWACQAIRVLKPGALWLELLNEAQKELQQWTGMSVSFHESSFFICCVSWLFSQVAEWSSGICSLKSQQLQKELWKHLSCRMDVAEAGMIRMQEWFVRKVVASQGSCKQI